jgi:hypothetical protein
VAWHPHVVLVGHENRSTIYLGLGSRPPGHLTVNIRSLLRNLILRSLILRNLILRSLIRSA